MAGLGDIVRGVIYRFKGDTSDLKSKIRDLRGEQRKAAKEQLREIEKQNEHLENHIKTWGRIAAGVGVAVAAYKIATSTLNHYAEHSRLASAAAGKDIDSLKKSTAGLITEMDLLRLAATANTGTFKLTQTQLDLVGQGIVALSREGHDLTQVTERVGQAIREGNVEPLKEFGLVIKDVEGDSLQALNAILAQFREMGPGVEQAGESVRRAQTEMTDGWDHLKSSIGEFVDKFDFAFDGLAKGFTFLGDHIATVAKYTIMPALAPIFAVFDLVEGLDINMTAPGATGVGLGVLGAGAASSAGTIPTASSLADARAMVAQMTQAAEPARKAALAEIERKKEEARRAAEKAAREQEKIDALEDARARSLAFGQRSVGVLGTLDFPGRRTSADITGPGAVGDELGEFLPLPPGMRRPVGEGTGRKEFDSMIQSAVAGSEAFAMFRNAALEAFSAIITGSASVGQAFKKLIGNMVLGQSMKAFANGLQATGEGALAFVLSGFNPAAAAPFAEAAFQNFAIAASLAAMAVELGANGGGAQSGGGRGGRTGLGAGMSNGLGPRFGNNPNDRTQNTTYILGDSFSDRSERERNRDLSSSLKRARMSSDANPSGSV